MSVAKNRQGQSGVNIHFKFTLHSSRFRAVENRREFRRLNNKL